MVDRVIRTGDGDIQEAAMTGSFQLVAIERTVQDVAVLTEPEPALSLA
jgi:hypothetical protein